MEPSYTHRLVKSGQVTERRWLHRAPGRKHRIPGAAEGLLFRRPGANDPRAQLVFDPIAEVQGEKGGKNAA
jgi:hypothetical protein